MGGPFLAGVGGVLSGDIAVPEHEREVAFYSSILTTGAEPLWRDDLMNNKGMAIIGLGERVPEYENLPLQWMPHILVADVAASAARAVELGGEEIMHGKDDAGASQWAVCIDPDGAAFGIIPVVAEVPEASGAVGCIAGISLTVRDAQKASDYYREVVGWSAREIEIEDAGGAYLDYEMCGEDGDAVARICHARGTNVGVPSVWLLRLLVGDLAESLERVRAGGGEVIQEDQGDDGAIRSAVVRDPVGVCIALEQG